MKTRHLTAIPPSLHTYFAWFAFGVMILLFVALITVNINPSWLVTVMVASALTLVFIYWRIRSQPAISMTLTYMHLQLHHPSGGWSVRWQDIQHVEQVSIEHDGWFEPIPWVGIKLRSYDHLMHSISPRLVSRILTDQRVLLIMSYRRGNRGSVDVEDMLFDDTPFTDHHGNTYTGLLATFANRLKYNNELLHSELLIPEEMLGLECDEFVGLARRYLAASRQEPD
uniref:DUF2982 domain-containing protein n=1 Tax=Thaumasiovibrio subtropicus TaxID=1891207 RepID=UPI00131C9D07|nr:DUF2982 domain-containing protein [Thaumasiovibrio subtropicus]